MEFFIWRVSHSISTLIVWYYLKTLFSLLFLLVKLFISSQNIHIFVQPACVAPRYQLNTTSVLYIPTHIQTTLPLHCPLPYAFLLTQISGFKKKETMGHWMHYLRAGRIRVESFLSLYFV